MQVEELQAELNGFQKEITVFLSRLRLPGRAPPIKSTPRDSEKRSIDHRSTGNRSRSRDGNRRGNSIEKTSVSKRSTSKDSKKDPFAKANTLNFTPKPDNILNSEMQKDPMGNGYDTSPRGPLEMAQIDGHHFIGSQAGSVKGHGGGYLDMFEKKKRATLGDAGLGVSQTQPHEYSTPLQLDSIKKHSLLSQNMEVFGATTLDSVGKNPFSNRFSMSKVESERVGPLTRNSKTKVDNLGANDSPKRDVWAERAPSFGQNDPKEGHRYGSGIVNAPEERKRSVDRGSVDRLSIDRGSLLAGKYDDFIRPEEIKNRHSKVSPDFHLVKDGSLNKPARETFGSKKGSVLSEARRPSEGQNYDSGESNTPKISNLSNLSKLQFPINEEPEDPHNTHKSLKKGANDTSRDDHDANDTSRFTNLIHTTPRQTTKFDAAISKDNRIAGLYLSDSKDELFLSSNKGLIVYDVSQVGAQRVSAQITLKDFDVSLPGQFRRRADSD